MLGGVLGCWGAGGARRGAGGSRKGVQGAGVLRVLGGVLGCWRC